MTLRFYRAESSKSLIVNSSFITPPSYLLFMVSGRNESRRLCRSSLGCSRCGSQNGRRSRCSIATRRPATLEFDLCLVQWDYWKNLSLDSTYHHTNRSPTQKHCLPYPMRHTRLHRQGNYQLWLYHQPQRGNSTNHYSALHLPTDRFTHLCRARLFPIALQ